MYSRLQRLCDDLGRIFGLARANAVPPHLAATIRFAAGPAPVTRRAAAAHMQGMDLTGALAIVAVFGVILALFLRFLRAERKRSPEARKKR